ncbi:dTDP-glucose 4,6-dehydratase [Pontiella sulfatireligans]|uniref:dTDP-glucose 4,6-dehydratase n=1 Tax=Pontiella sulfatireligans TaxID=2750658 RepID=A0A6C2UFH4_9BACT|nr:GDP-mannose 4,6-dehydratase [Pontiella sulfatireligans]VGO18277.1 dTDP-glucose 4,6-dehydratase [Pontiella sulfatireligans]
MKKLLVTGGLGFIGSYFVDMALKRGYYVINVDKMTYAARTDVDFHERDNYEFIEEDIATMSHIPPGVDYVVNFAAESHVDNSIHANEAFYNSNIGGVYNILELIRAKDETDRPILFHISTDEVYGTAHAGSFTEEDKLLPSNPYSATKAAAEQLIFGWRHTHGIKAIICRSCNNYGFGQYPEKLLAKTIEFLLNGKKMTVHGDGTYLREWIYAEDNCEGLLTVLEKGEEGQVYNVSSGEEHSVIDAVKMIVAEMGMTEEEALVHIPNRPGQDLRYSVDCSKARALGWAPKTTLKEYIPTYIELYKKKLGL